MSLTRFDNPVLRAVSTLTVVKLLVNAGFRFVYPFLPAIGRGLGVDLNQVGLLLSVRWVAGSTAPVAVAAMSRTPRSRRLLVVGLIGFGVGSVVTALTGAFVGAVVGFALVGLGKPIVDVGAATHVSERVPYRRRARALGILELSWAGGFLIGAPIAGWLIESWSWRTPFWVFGTVVMISVAGVILLLEPTDDGHIEGAPGVDLPWKAVIPLFAAVVMTGFTLEMILVVMGAWLEGEFGLTLLALAGVGFLLGAAELIGEGVMVGITDRLGKRNSFASGLLVAALALGVLALTGGSLAAALTALFAVVVALEFAVISGIPLASEYRPSNRARLLAWFMVAAGGGRIVADVIGPRIFQAGGMTSVALAAAVSALIGVVIIRSWVTEPS